MDQGPISSDQHLVHLSVRSGLARLMRSAGHRIVTFDFGKTFLTQAAQGVVGCVVLDISMSGLKDL